jgi:hypothetical protein
LIGLNSIRGKLHIPAFGRLRLLMEGRTDGDFLVRMECVACEAFVRWNGEIEFWECEACGEAYTDEEIQELLMGFYKWLGSIVGEGYRDTNEQGRTTTSTSHMSAEYPSWLGFLMAKR